MVKQLDIKSKRTNFGGLIKPMGAWAFTPQLSTLNPRSAITLTEVLISMGILTLGLLGVASMFPVGGFYMRSGDVTDRASAVAQAAFAELITRGMLDPENWLIMGSADGSDANTVGYDKRFREFLKKAKVDSNSLGAPAVRAQAMNSQFASAYAIDPYGVSAFQGRQGAIRFPFNAALGGIARPTPVEWQPWKPSQFSMINHPKWPVARLTVVGASPDYVPNSLIERKFSSGDDLSVALPERDDEPARQLWDHNNNGALSRQWSGDFTWLATVAPTTSEGRDALALDGSSQVFNVSVVVFYKREVGQVDDPVPSRTEDDSSAAEPLVGAKVLSKSSAGGELLLSHDVSPATDPFKDLRAGQWVMLGAPHPLTTNERQMFFVSWYRVLSVTGEDKNLDVDGVPRLLPTGTQPERRIVAVRGAEWPWDADGSALSADLRVGIFPSAVAVHTKTLRLGGSAAWSIP